MSIVEKRKRSVRFFHGESLLTPEGRKLGVQETGDPRGTPVIFFHGMPGSRLLTLTPNINLAGIRLISFDRPGYGDSTRKEGLTTADIAKDVSTIASALNLDTFFVLGQSGGGAYALACAALLEGVQGVATFGSLVAPEFEGWYEGMAPDNIALFRAADADPDELLKILTQRSINYQNNPESLLIDRGDNFGEERIEDDYREIFMASTALSVKQGPVGWFDDVVAKRKPWGFNLSTIKDKKIPVRILHGLHDTTASFEHAIWLGEQLGVKPSIIEDTRHNLASEIPGVLAWIREIAQKRQRAI